MLTMPTLTKRQSLSVLAVVLVAAFAINLDTTIVNVALPTLNVRLGAGTTSLQWVVDAYNLAFAALVLAGGNIGGVAGVIAHLEGKQPPDTHVWVLVGEAPAFVGLEGPFFGEDGIWKIDLVSPIRQGPA